MFHANKTPPTKFFLADFCLRNRGALTHTTKNVSQHSSPSRVSSVDELLAVCTLLQNSTKLMAWESFLEGNWCSAWYVRKNSPGEYFHAIYYQWKRVWRWWTAFPLSRVCGRAQSVLGNTINEIIGFDLNACFVPALHPKQWCTFFLLIRQMEMRKKFVGDHLPTWVWSMQNTTSKKYQHQIKVDLHSPCHEKVWSRAFGSVVAKNH